MLVLAILGAIVLFVLCALAAIKEAEREELVEQRSKRPLRMYLMNWKLLSRVVKSRLLVDRSRELLATSKQLIESSHGRRVPSKIAWSHHLQRKRDLPKKQPKLG